MKNFTLLFATLLLSLFTLAQAPQSFKFQTVIRDGDGEVLPLQDVTLKFLLRADAPDGEVAYAEQHFITTNALGLVSLNIGNGEVVSGNFGNLSWGNKQYFLEELIDVGNTGNFVLFGTVQLLSVPYALHANTAGNGIQSMSTLERDALENPAVGMQIYNTTTNCLNYWSGTNWFETCGDCTPQPSNANAGPDQTYFDSTTVVTLDGNIPEEGTGLWTKVTSYPGWFEDPNDPTTTFHGEPCRYYYLKWTISTSCGSDYDYVKIIFDDTPSDAYAGQDTVINTEILSINLSAVHAENGTGAWSIISGEGGSFLDDNEPNTVFTGLDCTDYELSWTVATECHQNTDTVNVEFYAIPTQANAGQDMTINDETLSINLDANTPQVGVGTWSIISGEGGEIDDAQNPNSGFIALPCETYELLWTIATACEASSDTLKLDFFTIPTQADAGEDQFGLDGTWTTLEANEPEIGEGQWAILSGEGGQITNPNSPASVFLGQNMINYVLEWQIATLCDTARDEVNIAFGFDPQNLPPNTPTNPIPDSFSINISTDTILSWYCTDPNGNPLHYDVYFGTEATLPQVATGIADTFYTPGTLGYATTYYWKIVAHDDQGNSTEGEVWSFATMQQNDGFSLEFNGIDNTINLGYIEQFSDDGDVTIEAWVKIDTSFDEEKTVFVLGGNGHVFLLVKESMKPNFTIAIGNNDHYGIDGINMLELNAWNHICGIYDNNSNTAFLYVNGVLENQLTTPNLNFIHPNSINSNIASYYQPFCKRYYNGLIAGVHLSQDIKYSGDFQPSYPITPTGNTIGLWQLNEGTGTIATDLSGNGNDGSIIGATWSPDVPEITNSTPTLPSNPNPENSSLNISIGTTLSWSCSDPENDPLSYDVYFGTETTPPIVVTGIADTFYTPGTLEYATTYHWKIVAHDNLGNSAEGEVWSFTTVEESPVGYWPFNGNVNDESGNQHHGEIIQGPSGNCTFVEDRNGIPNSALEFSGNPAWNAIGSYVKIPNDPVFYFDNSYTINFWINISNDVYVGEIINKGWDGYGFHSRFHNYAEHALTFGTPDGGVGYSTTDFTEIWHMVTFARNGITSEGAMYVDGNLVVNSTVGVPLVFDYDLWFGIHDFNHGNGSSYPLQGILDEVKIWNRELSQDEILLMFQD